MLYIHHTACISPQQSFRETDIDTLRESVNNQLRAVEPDYSGIPPGLLRRMGKAVKIGVGAALALLRDRPHPSGIVLGTANGGMEDCIKFLNQIIEYEEGILAPGNFVQSTTNAIASQLGLLNHNHAYNITHVHRGLAFENAVLDTMMLSEQNPALTYLLGGVDEISAYNYHIDFLGGWFKVDPASNLRLYDTDTNGSLAGEGAAMFLVNGTAGSALAGVKAIRFLHSDQAADLSAALKDFLGKESADLPVHWMISGENGDRRARMFSEACERTLQPETGIARFKHMSGEFPTASAFALWAACHLIKNRALPAHMIKKAPGRQDFRNILIYNSYKQYQHSFMLVRAPI